MKTWMALVVMMLIASSAFADWTEQRIGNTDFYNSSDGQSGTGQQIGNTYFYNGSNGQSVTCNKIGQTTFCN